MVINVETTGEKNAMENLFEKAGISYSVKQAANDKVTFSWSYLTEPRGEDPENIISLQKKLDTAGTTSYLPES